MHRRKSSRSPGDLPQRPESWFVVIHHLRLWIAPPDEAPTRPFAVLILNLETGMIQAVELISEYPTPKQLLSILYQVMQTSSKTLKQKPHRPQQIFLEDAALVTALKPELETINIRVQQQARLEGVDDLLADLEAHMREGEELPGLLSVQNVDPGQIGQLFAAAAEFYRAAPWVELSDQQTLAIQVEPEPEARFVQVMGGAGIEYGLAMYRRWEDVERIFSFADNPLELLPPEGGHSFSFDDITRMPFDDLDGIEQYGWEIAGKQAYPIPIVYSRNGEVKRPAQADLAWYEAALRAIPLFVRDYLEPGQPEESRPLEASFSIPTYAGETRVHIKYPAGTLSIETRPAHMLDWSELGEEEAEEVPIFDRRAMEGMMALFGPGFDDPNLAKAQELMYKAWEEQNPAQRIILAREALAISPDCADACVLLAEEEADTVGRALEYYRQGVEAGERALGQAYFEENAGHFWGLLETRPYMRARQGLADTLWELGRRDEAIHHYQEMLRLNPSDNQGIRYSLLNLLLSLDKDADARSLLETYKEDSMAEWLYTRALLLFRQEGASQMARKALQEALEVNPHVPAYLTGRKRVPARLPPYLTWGGTSEAEIYASSYLRYWRRTAGAVDWLQAHETAKPAKSKKGKKRRSKQSKR